MDHVYVAAPAQRPLPAFRLDGRHGDKQQLRSRCTCCVIWHTGTVPGEIPPCHAAHASAAHLIFPLPAFVCQVPRVPVCFAHLCQTEGSPSSASAVTPAQHNSDWGRQTSLNPIFNCRRAHLPPHGVLHSLSQ